MFWSRTRKFKCSIVSVHFIPFLMVKVNLCFTLTRPPQSREMNSTSEKKASFFRFFRTLWLIYFFSISNKGSHWPKAYLYVHNWKKKQKHFSELCTQCWPVNMIHNFFVSKMYETAPLTSAQWRSSQSFWESVCQAIILSLTRIKFSYLSSLLDCYLISCQQ